MENLFILPFRNSNIFSKHNFPIKNPSLIQTTLNTPTTKKNISTSTRPNTTLSKTHQECILTNWDALFPMHHQTSRMWHESAWRFNYFWSRRSTIKTPLDITYHHTPCRVLLFFIFFWFSCSQVHGKVSVSDKLVMPQPGRNFFDQVRWLSAFKWQPLISYGISPSGFFKLAIFKLNKF